MVWKFKLKESDSKKEHFDWASLLPSVHLWFKNTFFNLHTTQPQTLRCSPPELQLCTPEVVFRQAQHLVVALRFVRDSVQPAAYKKQRKKIKVRKERYSVQLPSQRAELIKQLAHSLQLPAASVCVKRRLLSWQEVESLSNLGTQTLSPLPSIPSHVQDLPRSLKKCSIPPVSHPPPGQSS